MLKHTGRTIAGRPCLPNVMSRMKREVVLEDEKPVERVDLIVQLLITVTGAWSGWWQAWGGAWSGWWQAWSGWGCANLCGYNSFL